MSVDHPAFVATGRTPLKAVELAVPDLDNDSLIVRLQMTVNHLSRWLTPITDKSMLMRSARRGEKSVFELLQELRDTELVAFARMNAIANSINPDLDKLPDPRYFRRAGNAGLRSVAALGARPIPAFAAEHLRPAAQLAGQCLAPGWHQPAGT